MWRSFFFFQAEDGIRDKLVTGVQTCALPIFYDKMAKALEHKGSKDKDYLRARDQISNELMGIRFTARTVERLSDSVRSLVDEIRRHERQIHDICVEKAQMPRQHFIRIFAGTEGSRRWLTGDINAAQPWSEALRRLEPSILELLGRSEEHTSELQSLAYLVCRLLLEKKNRHRGRIL